MESPGPLPGLLPEPPASPSLHFLNSSLNDLHLNYYLGKLLTPENGSGEWTEEDKKFKMSWPGRCVAGPWEITLKRLRWPEREEVGEAGRKPSAGEQIRKELLLSTKN